MRQLAWQGRNCRTMLQVLAIASISTTAAGQVVPDTSARPDSAAAPATVSSAPAGKMFPGISAGSRREDYLRTLQTLGVVRPYPWSLRAFSPRELDLLRPQTDSHPRFAAREFNAGATPLPFGLQAVPVSSDVWVNSTFAYGFNDGVVWRGRGVTAAVTGGVERRWGPVSLTLAPIAFYTQNHPFDLMPTGQPFGESQFWTTVDLPQRFGNSAFAEIDPGQSSLRVDTRFVTAGVSTANQSWGPMSEFPFLLGDNAGGYPHVFIGTGSPANLFVGTLHARVVYGRLDQSDYSPVTGPGEKRFTSGIVAVFSPRGLPTLEIGAGRFFHNVWPEGGPTSWEFRRPFETLFKSSLPVPQQAEDNPLTHVENQLASLFFRWVFPTHGLEIYGETGREDHSWDRRDLILEMEHGGTYGFGLAKAWGDASRVRVFRAETMNFQLRSGGLHRYEGGIYMHDPIRQGHTHRGQLLGAGFGVASASGSTATFEQHTPGGATVVRWSRFVRLERARSPLQTPWEIRSDEGEVDVQHVLEVEHHIDQNGRQIRLGLGGVYEFNRHFDKDAFNLMVSAGIDLFPSRRSRPVMEPPRASTAQ